jgi:PAS domain S-box-containing protein
LCRSAVQVKSENPINFAILRREQVIRERCSVPLAMPAWSINDAQANMTKEIHVGFIVFDPKHSHFWSLTSNCLQSEASERGVRLTTVVVNTVGEQVSQMQDLLAAHVDAFLIHPLAFDDPSLIEVVAKATAANVPVVLLDSGLDSDLPLTRVGTDNAGGQALVAEEIFRRLGGRGKVAYFQGDTRLGVGADRTNSFHAILPRYPEIDVVYEAMLDWCTPHSRAQEGADRMREALARCPDLQALICSADESALGAMSVIDEAGLTGKILVGGFDGIPEALMAIHEGRMVATGQQVSRAIARDAFDMVMQALQGRKLPRMVSTAVNLVTSDNVIGAMMETMRMMPGMIRSLVDHSEVQRKLQQAVISAQYNILQTMAAVSRAVSSIREPDEMMVKVVNLVRDRFVLDTAALYLIDQKGEVHSSEPNLKLRAVSGNSAMQERDVIRAGADSPIGACIRTGRARVVTDRGAIDTFEAFGASPEAIVAQAAFPLKAGEETIGVLAVQSLQEEAFDDDAMMVLQTIADQTAIALKSASLYAEQRNASAFLDSVLDNIPTSLNVKDARSMQYVMWNKAGEKLVGDTRAALLGKTAHDLFPKEIADQYMQRDLDIIKAGVMTEIPEEKIETRFSGTRILHTKRIPIAGTDGQVNFLVTVAEDITERKKTEEALVNRARELELAYLALKENQEKLLIAEKMASIGRLTAGIAHEMNTPLAAVRSSMSELRSLVKEYAEAIDDPDVNADDHREIVGEMEQAIQIASTSAERAAGFVRGVKAQTRDMAARQGLWFNAVQVVEEAILLLSHVLREAKCTVVFDKGENVPDMYGSPGRLAQVVTNLVGNAADASAEAGGEIRVCLAPTDGNKLLLQVSDSGSGIDPEIITRIFDPMFTTKPFGKGTGLGLSIVHDIVVGDFNGKLDVASTKGEGTTFSALFVLPQKGEEAKHGA